MTNDERAIRDVIATWMTALTITPPGGKPMRRAGYTLTTLRKQPDGSWRATPSC